VQLLGGEAGEAAVSEPEPAQSGPRAPGEDRIGEIEGRLERLEQAFDDLLGRLDKVPGRE
jgi:uncharacterized protein YceH (UPF0502 family)